MSTLKNELLKIAAIERELTNTTKKIQKMRETESKLQTKKHEEIKKYNLARVKLLAQKIKERGLAYCLGCGKILPSEGFSQVNIHALDYSAKGYDEHPDSYSLRVHICPTCSPLDNFPYRNGSWRVSKITSQPPWYLITVDFGDEEWEKLYHTIRDWMSPYISRQLEEEYEIPVKLH